MEKGLRNYWGYSTLAFFAPERRYLGEEGIAGFKVAIRSLHDAGIEVILDVAYNHTAEGNQLGPTLSFRGIDNASYYKLTPHDPRFNWDCTGTGNTLDVSHPRVLQMVLDSLRYWVEHFHVDGFRFDLAPALTRDYYDVNERAAFLRAIAKIQHSPGSNSLRSPGTSERVAITSAASRPAGANGTITSAIPYAPIGVVIPEFSPPCTGDYGFARNF